MSRDLDIAVERDGHRALLHITGLLDAYTGDLLLSAITEQIETGITHIDVDASEVTFVDSGGLRVFTDVNGHLENRGGRLQIINPSGPMAHILRITDLAHRFGL